MNTLSITDEKYMRRCIQLARNGQMNAQPNPMVGAVIVYKNKIIGEGYHVRCGEGHAEVNACASVKPENEHLLKESTIYVSLEPCSHDGKTPPCADLLISKGFKRCVIGCQDPFAKVKGHGIQKLKDAGIEVKVGVLEDECKLLNKRFITFHGKHRPYVTLKWAQSADGYIDGHISNVYTQMRCHQLRSTHQAILVGRCTYEKEHPLLNIREWIGNNPQRYVASSQSISLPEGYQLFNTNDISKMLDMLYEQGIQTLLVEGGAKLHQSFIDSGLWDECCVEYGVETIHGKVVAPILKNAVLKDTNISYEHRIDTYVKA